MRRFNNSNQQRFNQRAPVRGKGGIHQKQRNQRDQRIQYNNDYYYEEDDYAYDRRPQQQNPPPQRNPAPRRGSERNLRNSMQEPVLRRERQAYNDSGYGQQSQQMNFSRRGNSQKALMQPRNKIISKDRIRQRMHIQNQIVQGNYRDTRPQ